MWLLWRMGNGIPCEGSAAVYGCCNTRIAGPPVAWACSPMVKIGTPATNYTARWVSLSGAWRFDRWTELPRHLKPVFCNIWFCGRLFLVVLFSYSGPIFTNSSLPFPAPHNTERTNSPKTTKEKKNDCFTFWPLRDESTFTTWGHPDRQQKNIVAV